MTTLYRLAVVVAPEAEEAVSELLFRLTRQPAVISHDPRTGESTVIEYLQNPAFDARTLRSEIRGGLKEIARCGLSVAPALVSWRRVPRTDWQESWKRHFRPIQIGTCLVVRPSWSPRRAGPRTAEVVLDPGLSFGTGQHATTQFCLREIVRLRPRAPDARTLCDVGTGSGILAIAAAKLGYHGVKALDSDPDAVRVARQNAKDNAVDRVVRVVAGDVRRLPITPRRTFDVVCANLTADLLAQNARRLLEQVRPGGHLILAGILEAEFAALKDLFLRLGTVGVRDRRQGEWHAGSFRRGPFPRRGPPV